MKNVLICTTFINLYKLIQISNRVTASAIFQQCAPKI